MVSSVKIVFDPPFSDIPSVIVSPIFDCVSSPNYIPRCMVESITKSFARVKCIASFENSDGFYLFYPIPFTFAAVGNTN